MKRIKRNFFVLVILSVIFLLTVGALPAAGVSVGSSGSRFSGSVNVPQWEKGDKWGYKVPQYAYSSDYYGVGFEVVGTETVNGDDCYKVRIWWDASFGVEENENDMDMNIPGFLYSYRYEGYVYYTKDKLAIAKFTMELQMKMQYDGSKFSTSYYTRAQDGYDFSDYTDYLEKMKKWKYDISYEFSMGYTYTPPFVMYDYPLELNKRWNSSSEVEVSWEYSTHIWMNSAMKNDIEEMYGGEYPGLDAADEEGSDSAQFTLSGSFEVAGNDTIETETGSHEVFTIAYDISMGLTRAGATPPESYGGMSVPGGDATLSLIGGSDGSGTSYFDPKSGYPQKMDSGNYFTESYTTVEPSTIDNSYDDEVDTKNSGGGDSDIDANSILLLILAGVIGTVVLLVVIIVVVLIKRSNRYQDQRGQYPNNQERYPPQNQQQQYSREQYPREQYPTQGPQQQYPREQYPPQRPEDTQRP